GLQRTARRHRSGARTGDRARAPARVPRRSGRDMAGMSSPFTGLPVVWAVPLGIGLAVIALMLLWTALLFVRGQRARTHAPPAPADAADRFTWVFLVPALNEQVTIRDSVNRLLALDVAHRRIVVIDDGSDDATTQILAEL